MVDLSLGGDEMSTEGRLGPKKLRLAEDATGRDLLMAFAWHPWVECVTSDDSHVWWNPDSGEVRVSADPTHYSTCPLP